METLQEKRAAFQIRNLERCQEGNRTFWTAILVSGTTRVRVNRRYGSWIIERPDGTLADLMPDWAARLQAKVRPIERRERRTPCAA